MSFKIGQYRKQSTVTYIDSLSNFEKTIENNKMLFTTTTNLLTTEKYYLKINIKRKDVIQIIKLTLQDSVGQNIQKVATYVVPVATDLIVNEFYEKIFVPISSTYSIISFEVDGQAFATEDIEIEIYRIENVLNFINLSSLVRIGVQAVPGQLLCINGEGIRVGLSGLYELNHPDIIIDFIGFIPIEENFILDYQY